MAIDCCVEPCVVVRQSVTSAANDTIDPKELPIQIWPKIAVWLAKKGGLQGGAYVDHSSTGVPLSPDCNDKFMEAKIVLLTNLPMRNDKDNLVFFYMIQFSLNTCTHIVGEFIQNIDRCYSNVHLSFCYNYIMGNTFFQYYFDYIHYCQNPHAGSSLYVRVWWPLRHPYQQTMDMVMAPSHFAFFRVADAFPMEIDKHQAMFRRYNRTFGELSASIYAQNRKASGSIVCTCIHLL